MKYKTTRKQVMNSGRKVIQVGYCDLQYLLDYHYPNAYTVRTEGWASDIYDIGSATICTGYAPFGNVKPNYEVVRKYDQEARKVILSGIGQEEQKLKLEVLLNEFIREVTL